MLLTINGKSHDVDVEPDTPLLWVIRDSIGMTGTKYGCGIAQCGACTVHIDGAAVRSCGMTAGDAVGKKITTIEGLAENGTLTKVQQAWIDLDVPQCGYCQAGQKTEKANNTGCSESHLTSRKLRNDHARPINLFLAADKEDRSKVIILAYVFEKLLSSIPAHLEFV